MFASSCLSEYFGYVRWSYFSATKTDSCSPLRSQMRRWICKQERSQSAGTTHKKSYKKKGEVQTTNHTRVPSRAMSRLGETMCH